MKTTRRSCYEERTEDFSFSMHPLGNPSFERAVTKPDTSKVGQPVDVMQFGFLWTVPHKDTLAACKAQSEAELVALGAVKVRTLLPGEDD